MPVVISVAVSVSIVVFASIKFNDTSKSSTTPTSISTATLVESGPIKFNTTAANYVQSFNSSLKSSIHLSNEAVQDLHATVAGPGLLGNKVTSSNGLYIIADGSSGNVHGIIVTMATNNGTLTVPLQMISVACAGLLPSGSFAAANETFNRDSANNFSKIGPSVQISIANFYDIRIVKATNEFGFVCIERGASVPDAAQHLP